MKNFLYTIALLLFFYHSNAQNVGIGTETPAFKLDVNGRMRIKTAVLNNLSTTPGMWMDDYRDGSNRMFFGMQDSIRIGFYGAGVGGLGWQFNFNAKTGNVGIGRTAGASKLELNGGIAIYTGNIFGGSIKGESSDLIISAAPAGICYPGPCYAGNLILQPPPPDAFSSYGNVGIGVSVPTARLQIDKNVLIGIGSPATGYALSVKGKIIAQEMKIQLAASWPDYVFKDDYALPSIEQMESFIKDNKHLSNIPAASEVENDGLLVGDMQKKMMEKIEELSLYIIKLNDRIKQLEEKK
jgi:hypothetical protein